MGGSCFCYSSNVLMPIYKVSLMVMFKCHHWIGHFWVKPKPILPLCSLESLTLMLVVANLAITKWCKNLKNDKFWHMGTLLRILNMPIFRWFSKDLHPCALDEARLMVRLCELDYRALRESYHNVVDLWVWPT